MNKRITELYIQTANETADGKEWSIGGMENAQHFAELIILECAKIVATAVEHREPASTYVSKILELRNETSKAD